MFDWFTNTFKPYTYNDYLQTKALEAAAKNGAASIASPIRPNSQSMPWYITGALVVVGGVLLYKYGAKLLKV